ncbi:DUF4919 domain-containing protein [uncultured Lutibacter sp.]|uniref:DUF4919 domain-containing protein n=1 Tax=uncultured Lutibacter sp. TaxID=437739 RepID=UPI00260C47D7|nr:DUF4919 domain-containing protein [uncultured Lutibacter sp.]
MKKRPLLLLFMLSVLIGFSQNKKKEKPNYKKIERMIKKENSDFYYPKLVAKFNAADTTLTLQEKRLLYYGFSFQKNYSPFENSTFKDSLKTVLSKSRLTNLDYSSVVKYADSILVEFPFNFQALNYKLIAFKSLQNKNEFIKTIIQMRTIIDAITSSGDGKTEETAIYVVNVSHEYLTLSALGLKFSGEQSLINHYDYLSVAENPKGIKGLYFDISPSLNALGEMLK